MKAYLPKRTLVAACGCVAGLSRWCWGCFPRELRSGARWGGQAMIEGRGNSRSEARKLERRPPWGGCGLVALVRGVFVVAVVAVFNAALFFTFFY